MGVGLGRGSAGALRAFEKWLVAQVARRATPPSGDEERVRNLAATIVTLASLATLGLITPHVAWADKGDPPAASASGAASTPLAELPKLPPITRPEPDPQALKDLDRLLERLTSEDERSRTNARTAVSEVEPSVVPAIAHRIQDVRASIDREAAGHLLEDARKAGRKSLKKGDKPDAKGDKPDAKGDKPDAKGDKPGAKGDKSKHAKDKEKDHDDDGDWLDFLLAKARPKDKTWRDLVALTAMNRMLAAVGTTAAMRQLVAHYAFFGDLVRVDLQRLIAKLRDRAVPALIEARQHDAKNVQKWSAKQLDILGRAIPGEAVATSDTQVLADVLRAYGRVRDVDASRVILSFCNSEHVLLREAAREAVAAIGEPGMWQLRDVYLGMTGGKPPREWAWDRLARELFGLYDRARQAEVHKLMEDGVAAAKDRRWKDATDLFDRVLAHAPLFDRRKEMVPAYIERAKDLQKPDADAALAMLRKALRLDPKGPAAKKTEADIDTLEAVLLAERGTPDRHLLARALELDPTNDRARAAMAGLEEKAEPRQTDLRRYAAAGAIGVVALAAMVLLARRRRDPEPGVVGPAPAPQTPSSPAAPPDAPPPQAPST